MREEGVVVKESKGYVEVKVDKKDACSKCGMCLFSENANHTIFTAKNVKNAKVDDKVIIDVKEKGKLLSIFLIFLVPLILIGLSAVIAFTAIKKDIWMLILSVIFIVVWYTILGFIDKKLKLKTDFCPEVVEIIDKGDSENE